MLIEDLEDIKFTIQKAEGFTEMSFLDPADEVLGTFLIKDEKGITFLRSLLDIFTESRGVYGEYDANKTSRTLMKNKSEGTLHFNGD